MKKLTILWAMGLLVLGLTSCSSSEENIAANDPHSDFQIAQQHIENEEWGQALDILSGYEESLAHFKGSDTDWLSLLIKVRFEKADIAELLTLYQHFPEAFMQHEDASVFVASAFIAGRSPADFDAIRKSWAGHETLLHRWQGVDVDYLIIQGKRDEALRTLRNQTFEGDDDTGRLVRLALIEGQKSSKAAWEYLTEAQRKDDDNPDIRSLRARMLENLDRPSLAQVEYTAAARLAPDRPELRNQLAEFHVRQGQYIPALQVWAYGLKEPTNDVVWTRALFWQAVTQVVDSKLFSEPPLPEGDLRPYLDYLLAMPEESYWDPIAFEKLDRANRLLQTEQSTFWLRLIQALKDGREQEALSLLEFNTFRDFSWAPELEKNLRRVLLYRQTGRLAFDGDRVIASSKAPKVKNEAEPAQHQFYKLLDQLVADLKTNPTLQINPHLQNFLLSEEALAATFMAGSWLEAGLQLHQVNVIPKDYPDWVAFAVAQSLRFNRGTMAALDFINKQDPSPSLQMLEGELLIASGSPESGIEKLKIAVNTPGPVGLQSAWRLTLALMQTERLDEALASLSSNSDFAHSMTGRELQARISLMKGDNREATRLYSAISNESSEAQSFLARMAYDEGNWQQAKKLTEQLLRKHPNSLPLRVNYKKIIDQLKAEESGIENAGA